MSQEPQKGQHRVNRTFAVRVLYDEKKLAILSLYIGFYFL